MAACRGPRIALRIRCALVIRFWLLWVAGLCWPLTDMSQSDLILGAIAPVLQLALAIIFVRRRLHGRFPYFFSYTVYSLVAIVLRVSVISHPSAFFVAYWSTDILSAILALLVIREVFLPTLTGLPEPYRWIRWIMPTAVAMIVALAIWNAAYRPIGRGPLSSLAAGVYSFDLGIRWLELLIFLVAAALDRTRWRSLLMNQFSILAGFGIAALLTLVADLGRVQFGSRFEEIFRYLPTSAYICAAVIWLAAFLYKEPDPAFRLTGKHLTVMEEALKRQQEALDKLRGKDKTPRLSCC